MRARRTLVVFVVVNVLNTALYWLLYLLFLLVVPYLVANVLALAIAIVVAYLANARFAFQVRTSGRSLALFAITNLTTMVLRTAVVWMLVEFLAVGEVLAPLLAAGITLPVAYVLTALVMRGRSPGGTGSGQRLGVPAAAGVVPASRTAA